METAEESNILADSQSPHIYSKALILLRKQEYIFIVKRNMASARVSKIFIIGGTGAQGIPVIRGLVKDKKYSCLVLTRDKTSKRAQDLLALGNVELMEGSFGDEVTLRKGFNSCDGAFVNIDGFNTGEKPKCTGQYAPMKLLSSKASGSSFMETWTIH